MIVVAAAAAHDESNQPETEAFAPPAEEAAVEESSNEEPKEASHTEPEEPAKTPTPAASPTPTPAAETAVTTTSAAAADDTGIATDVIDSTKRGSEDEPSPNIALVPQRVDVIFGNKEEVAGLKHRGTKEFNSMIFQFVDPYKDFKSRNEGFRVLESIRDHIFRQKGKFLELISLENHLYYQIEPNQILEKIEQALEEAIVVKEASADVDKTYYVSGETPPFKSIYDTQPPTKAVPKNSFILSASSNSSPLGGFEIPFPWKLHEMLEDAFNADQAWIVSWALHGRAFIVHKPNIFVEKIMLRYFNQTKFASFQRQLNLYGFQRLSHGEDKGGYYHRCFLRGQPDLSHKVIRQKVKGTKVRRKLETEPNLYKFPYMPEIEKSDRPTRTASDAATYAVVAPKVPLTANGHPVNVLLRRPTLNSLDIDERDKQLLSVQPRDKALPIQPNSTVDGKIEASDSGSKMSPLTNKNSVKGKDLINENTIKSKTTESCPRTVAMKDDSEGGRCAAPLISRTSSNGTKETDAGQKRSAQFSSSHSREPKRRSISSTSQSLSAARSASNSASKFLMRGSSSNDLRAQVGNLAQATAEKDQEISRLRKEVIANGQKVERLRQATRAKDREIFKLTEELARKDRKLAKMEMERGKVLKGLFVKESWENIDTFRDNLYI